MDARSILHCDLSLYISWTRTDQHMIKQRLNVLRSTFLTFLFSKWIWHFKKTFNEKVLRIPHSSYVSDFSISPIGGYLLAYPIPHHPLVADSPRRRSPRSIILGGTGTLMRQCFVTFSLFAEALCLYFSRATHFIWIYRPVPLV